MGVVAGGIPLKKALQWTAEARRENPDRPFLALVDEASMRFNLSPKEADALLHTLKTASKSVT